MPKSEDFQGRLTEEQRRLLERQETINEVHKNYAKFGSRVVQVVLRHVSQPTGIRDLVSKLPVSGSATSPKLIHAQILRYIHDFGVAAFLSAVSNRPDTPRSPVKKAPPEPLPLDPASPPSEEALPTLTSPDGQWIWVDRRIQERRTGKIKRRARIESIMKNRRFGGERRARQDRRLKLTPPPWPAEPKIAATP